ncbi:DEAD/DEAH box helicase [Nioella sp.]|uniref:DEAD/DEAH box helicase n=1 Tax=Nioella sp. TaxID=1912091 RepID=UPI003A8AEA29
MTTTTVDDLLASYRAAATTERDKGTYFERLCSAFLTADPVQGEQYEQVWHWADWVAGEGASYAGANGWTGKDVGIDLVAKLRGHPGYAAIQCKFYDAHHRIAQADLSGFLTVSAKDPFHHRVVMDSTVVEWSSNAEAMMLGLDRPVIRIGLGELRASPIQWGQFASKGDVVLAPKKELRPHQVDALDAVRAGFAEHDRGKVIMACGTGKTFTSLKIAEDVVGADGTVLFLVPSLALMAQTVREWTTDTTTPMRSFAVCSDTQVGKRRAGKDDVAEISSLDLAFPATTDAQKLAQGVADPAPGKMTVVFATYQSIGVVSDAQLLHGMPRFDLIICDEAHRTTGATLDGQAESNFVRVHNDEVIGGNKRLYMTATPRIFGDGAKSKADEERITLATMDDEDTYGPTFFYRGFGWAVQEGLLTDYKVIVLAMDEGLVARSVQKRMADDTNSLQLDDATKIVGCYKALTKADLATDVGADTQPMKRALAFCRDIASSKMVRDEFAAVVDEFLGFDPVLEADAEPQGDHLHCQIQHVDGTYNAKTRGELLDWLKAEPEDHTCRILTNARCLSEGVDVPALDAIMFLHPRKSQIDVVQSVGRVMRRAPGKRMGYVILPVGVPAGVPPEQALADNEKYRVVWQILNALRAHDERFDGTINQIDLGQDVSDRIQIIGVSGKPEDSEELQAVTATVENLPNKTVAKSSGIGSGAAGDRDDDLVIEGDPKQPELPGFVVDEFTRAIRAKIVKKCGTRDYWEDWASSIADIAQAHITRITAIIEQPDTPERAAFDAFLAELRDDLNEGISEEDAVEMLAQHIITRPVFEVLFEGHQFTQENPVSRAIQGVLGVLSTANLDKENRDLEKFYASVQARASGITDPKAKQELIRQLYDRFFAVAFKRVRDKLGIVYTPVEIVDFILQSVNDVLEDEFGQTIGSPGVHIIDPFTGTGTFVTRLLQSGLIKPEEMEHKFRHELHANEIVLLAYYIAAINIEAVYHGVQGGEDYVPFEGICLTDTFQMYEKGDLVAQIMPDNSERRKRQRELDIQVIIGNPPYAVSHHINYPHLDGRIGETYAARSTATNKNALYDSYIRAIRWGSDRLGDSGVLAYVTNGGWVDANTADGMRKSLADEFTSIYVFHLRGNQRTSGETSRREGGKIFGGGSRAPIVITLFIKNPEAEQQGQIFFHDIGDYLSQQDKLNIIRSFGSIRGITARDGWQVVEPDKHGDWLKQRDGSFADYIAIGDKKSDQPVLFANYSAGLKSQRDAWAFNSSRKGLEQNIQRTVTYYNRQLDAFKEAKAADASTDPDAFTKDNLGEISWSAALKNDFSRQKPLDTTEGQYVPALYRPFFKQWLYFSRRLNERQYQIPRIFPEAGVDNRVIVVKQRAQGDTQFALMTDRIIELQTDGGTQCFPLKLYEEAPETDEGDLFAGEASDTGYTVRDGITDAGLKHFQAAYPGETITKEDIFYYVYGLLHSPDYRDQFADNLSKELPRIPTVKTAADFWAFTEAGSQLGDLHINYETVEPYPVVVAQGDLRLADIPDPEAFFRVTKMRFGGKGRAKDKTTIIYNSNITITDIPKDAYSYVVNGKPAIEWVMERQAVKTDTKSGITNDANRYATETVGDPRYPFDLLCRVITVSLETVAIVKALPKLDI